MVANTERRFRNWLMWLKKQLPKYFSTSKYEEVAYIHIVLWKIKTWMCLKVKRTAWFKRQQHIWDFTQHEMERSVFSREKVDAFLLFCGSPTIEDALSLCFGVEKEWEENFCESERVMCVLVVHSGTSLRTLFSFLCFHHIFDDEKDVW